MNKITSKYIDDEILYEVMPNGLTVYYYPSSNFRRSCCLLGVNYGGINHKFKFRNQKFNQPTGLAHFIEHRIFEMDNGEDAFYTLTNIGANTNAYTSNTMTSYMFSTSGNILRPLKLMFKFAFEDSFKQESIDRERGIILQEREACLSDPKYVMSELLMTNLYTRHPLHHPIVGHKKDIMEVNVDDFKLAYQAFYQPQNMFLVLSGNYDMEATREYLLQQFSEKIEYEPVEPLIDAEVDSLSVPLIINKMNINNQYLSIGIRVFTSGSNDDEFAYNALYYNLFSSSSFLYYVLLDKKLITEEYDFYAEYDKTYSFVMLNMPTNKYQEIIDEIRKLFTNFNTYLDKNLFERYKKIRFAQEITTWDNLDDINMEIAESINKGAKPGSSFEYLENLFWEDVVAKTKDLKIENVVFLLSLPKN